MQRRDHFHRISPPRFTRHRPRAPAPHVFHSDQTHTRARLCQQPKRHRERQGRAAAAAARVPRLQHTGTPCMRQGDGDARDSVVTTTVTVTHAPASAVYCYPGPSPVSVMACVSCDDGVLPPPAPWSPLAETGALVQ